MSNQAILTVLKEAMEGGETGAGTAFVENTRADGIRYGLLPTLARLSAEQASQDVYGSSIAGHSRHAAYHMEVTLRWAAGERGPFDWQGSFLPSTVTAQEWQALQERLSRAYTQLRQANLSDEDLAAGLAHAAYHLGAVRQMVKGVEK